MVLSLESFLIEAWKHYGLTVSDYEPGYASHWARSGGDHTYPQASKKDEGPVSALRKKFFSVWSKPEDYDKWSKMGCGGSGC